MDGSNSSRAHCVGKDLSQVTEEHCDNAEATPLLVKKTGSTCWSRSVLRYKTTRKCVSSKSALLILFWSFIAGLWYGIALNPDAFFRSFSNYISALVCYAFAAIVFCFYPLAGFLADVKYGRYKMVVRSLCVFFISIPLSIIIFALAFGTMFGFRFMEKANFYVTIFWGMISAMILLVSSIGLTGFAANVVQFGMDQLHDSPGEDRTLFIHWVYFVTIVISQLAWNLALGYRGLYNYVNPDYSEWYTCTGIALLLLIPLLVIVLLIVTLCMAKRRRNWFLIEPGTINPYKLVYRVTKFARQHKTPVRRSAFTYCEDEIPTGLDLGKEKYGEVWRSLQHRTGGEC